jgi:hypothetical protein
MWRSRRGNLAVEHFALILRIPNNVVLVAIYHVVDRFVLLFRSALGPQGISNATSQPHFIPMPRTAGAFIRQKSGKIIISKLEWYQPGSLSWHKFVRFAARSRYLVIPLVTRTTCRGGAGTSISAPCGPRSRAGLNVSVSAPPACAAGKWLKPKGTLFSEPFIPNRNHLRKTNRLFGKGDRAQRVVEGRDRESFASRPRYSVRQ